MPLRILASRRDSRCPAQQEAKAFYIPPMASLLRHPRILGAVAVLLVAIAAAAAFGWRNFQDNQRALQAANVRVAEAVALVRARLPDPKSAEFRDVSARPNVVCGEVNYRDGTTATGYRWFIVGPAAPGGLAIDRPGTRLAEGHCAGLPRLFPGKS